MLSALEHPGPVVFLEHKLLSKPWLDFLGRGGRESVSFDVPHAGARARVPRRVDRVPIGKAQVRRDGEDVSMVSLGVGVHRALEAAEALEPAGVSCEVIDLRTVRPLDAETVVSSVRRTGRLLVVDEDYQEFGLSGELAARVLAAGLTPGFRRVCVDDTLPYARRLEREALPNVGRIAAAVDELLVAGSASA
jgi:pyruvate dehydrogenase E1 component beta subunit